MVYKAEINNEILTYWSHDKVMLLMSIGLGLKVDAPSKDSYDRQQISFRKS